MFGRFFQKIKEKLTKPSVTEFISEATKITLQLTSVGNMHSAPTATLWANNNQKALSDDYLTLCRLFEKLADTKVTKLHIIVKTPNNEELGKALCNLPTNVKTLSLAIPETYRLLLPDRGKLPNLEELSIIGDKHRSLSLINRCPQLKKIHLSHYTLLASNHELEALFMNTSCLKKIHIDKVTSSSLAHTKHFCKTIENYKNEMKIIFKEIDASGPDATAIMEMLENFSRLDTIRKVNPTLPEEVVKIIGKKLM